MTRVSWISASLLIIGAVILIPCLLIDQMALGHAWDMQATVGAALVVLGVAGVVGERVG